MAHGFMQSFDSRLDVFSAGTEPASRVNPQAVEVMAEARHRHRQPYAAPCVGTPRRAVGLCDHRLRRRERKLSGVHGPRHAPPAHRVRRSVRAMGTPEFIAGEFRRVRDEIKTRFYRLYAEEIKPQLL